MISMAQHPVTHWLPSPNFDARGEGTSIDMVVLHYTGMQNAEIALQRLRDPAPIARNYPGPWSAPVMRADDQAARRSPDDGSAMLADDTLHQAAATALARVSAHYVVHEAGRIDQLVAEHARAWHAGLSCWQQRRNLNACSIGIEIVNGGHDFGLPAFPDVQIDAVIALVRDIVTRHNIPAARVLGHSDIAPSRKPDPGEHFPWHRLAQAGLGLWPHATIPMREGTGPVWRIGTTGMEVEMWQRDLARLGYDLDPKPVFDAACAEVVIAFHRHFRPDFVEPVVDPHSRILLSDLLAQL